MMIRKDVYPGYFVLSKPLAFSLFWHADLAYLGHLMGGGMLQNWQPLIGSVCFLGSDSQASQPTSVLFVFSFYLYFTIYHFNRSHYRICVGRSIQDVFTTCVVILLVDRGVLSEHVCNNVLTLSLIASSQKVDE